MDRKKETIEMRSSFLERNETDFNICIGLCATVGFLVLAYYAWALTKERPDVDAGPLAILVMAGIVGVFCWCGKKHVRAERLRLEKVRGKSK